MYKVKLLVNLKQPHKAFSFCAMQTANRFNIDGYVKYLNDENFLIEIEGYAEQLNKFVEWCDNNSFGSVLKEYKLQS